MCQIISYVIMLSLVFTIASSVTSSASAAPSVYTITDLGTVSLAPPACSSSNANPHINNAGQVLGVAVMPSGTDCLPRAFLWKDGSKTWLPDEGGDAHNLNDAGKVVGIRYPASPEYYRGYVWSPSTGIQDLLSFPNGRESKAHAINNSDQIVGNATDSGSITHAVLWENNAIVETLEDPTNAAVSTSRPWAINSFGHVVGDAQIGSCTHAILWEKQSDGTHVALDLGIPNGSVCSSASDVNDSIQIVGGTGGQSILWENGNWTYLDTLPGACESAAVAINSIGQIVGYAVGCSLTEAHSLLYQDGTMTDLLDLLPPDSGWTNLSASDINDAGQIAGTGTFNGEPHHFFLMSLVPPDDFMYPMDVTFKANFVKYDYQNTALKGKHPCYGMPYAQIWHAGEDWFAPVDTPVNAVADGEVLYSSNRNDKSTTTTYPGGVVIIKHILTDGSPIYSMYAHLNVDKILVAKNEQVTKGQRIADGLVLQTLNGKSNVHLHWEMRYFFDGSGINKASANYTKSCAGIPGPGYTYNATESLAHPDNFAANGGAVPTYHWTNPSQFVETH